MCGVASAVVQHPSSPGPVSRPPDAVVARWSDNGSAIAIAPNYVVTTAHQGLLVGNNIVRVGSTAYRFDLADVHQHPQADLRVVKIQNFDGTPANLTSYVEIFNPTTDGNESGKEVALGGYGRGADSTLTSGGLPYGYAWTTTAGNSILRWGANRVDFTIADLASSGRVSDVLVSDFDPVGQFGAVAGESALATYDSGGGWFVNVDGTWKVAGLSAYVQRSGQSWFRNPSLSTAVPSGDSIKAIQLSSYKSFIYSTFADLFIAGDMDGNAVIDNFDVDDFELVLTQPDQYLALHPTLTNYALRGDIDGDGTLSNFDIQHFEMLLTSGPGFVSGAASSVDGAPVPEPASAVLLGAGLAVLVVVGRRLRRKTA